MFAQGRITIIDTSSDRARKSTYNVCAHSRLWGGTHKAN